MGVDLDSSKDAMVVPFDAFLPWSAMTFKPPMPRTLHDLLEILHHLEAIPVDRGIEMQRQLAAHR
eukprot:1714046-Amphidinium_carterae.1